MDFDALAYPDIFVIGDNQHKGQRNRSKGEVLIPYTTPPMVQIGDRILQKNGPNTIELQVIDVDYQEEGSLGVGTSHPHILTLSVKNLASAAHQPAAHAAIHIGNVSGHQVQVGNQNTQVVSITLEDVVKQVVAAGDSEAKGILRKLFENNTVAAIVGAGVAGLISAVGGSA